MAINAAVLVSGSTVSIGNGAAAPARITSGGTAVGLITNIGDNTQAHVIGQARPVNADRVMKAKSKVRDPGSLSITVVSDGDETGQAALKTAYGSTNAYPILITASNGNTVNGVGYVESLTQSAGDDGTYYMSTFTFNLTLELV